MATKEFTIAEVAEHNTREDLYLIIRDEVYSVSKFVTEVSLKCRIYLRKPIKSWKCLTLLISSCCFLSFVASRWDFHFITRRTIASSSHLTLEMSRWRMTFYWFWIRLIFNHLWSGFLKRHAKAKVQCFLYRRWRGNSHRVRGQGLNRGFRWRRTFPGCKGLTETVSCWHHCRGWTGQQQGRQEEGRS